MDLTAKFPIECLEVIFRHLVLKDLLECTLVCPEWNLFIGWTKSCMQKIKFRIPGKILHAEITRKILINSDRKYEILHIYGAHSENMEHALKAKGRRWTEISLLRGLKFETFSRYQDFLTIFEPSVRKLTLNVFIPEEKSNYEYKDLQFP